MFWVLATVLINYYNRVGKTIRTLAEKLVLFCNFVTSWELTDYRHSLYLYTRTSYNRCNCKLMKGAVEAGTFSLTTITCSQSFLCFVYNFVCIIRDGLHTE